MSAFLVTVLAFLVGLPLLLALGTEIGRRVIERLYPPVGRFADVDGIRLHFVFWPAEPQHDGRKPVLFIHGASGNLRDQTMAMERYRGLFPMIFVDRPGHGWSERRKGHDRPDGQARAIAALLAEIAPAGAIVVGHSFGGAVALNLAMNHGERVRGLLLLSPASHPWPGGVTNWYYRLAARPLLGRLFVRTLAMPGGALRIGAGIACVFAPNRVTPDYWRRAAIPLVFRPANFRANAIDVDGLFTHVTTTHDRYGEIGCPTIVVTGDADTVVYEHVHSIGCARDIAGARLHVIANCGHKSDHVARAVSLAALNELGGMDLSGIGTVDDAVADVEASIAADREGPDCALEKPSDAPALLAAASR